LKEEEGMARNLHKYEELTPNEFDREKERASIIYIAAGPMEFHEECNALGIDPLKGYQWCLAAAEITGGIVFPLVPFAPAGPPPYCTRDDLRKRNSEVKFGQYTEQPLLYPSVMTSRKVCRALYLELLENCADDLKFKMCVFFGSHGPAGSMIKEIVSEADGNPSDFKGGYQKIAGDFHGMRVMAVGSLDYNLDVIREYYQEKDVRRINHGGLWETAINYAINPEFFQPKYLDAEKYPQHYGSLSEEHFEGCLRPTRSEYRKFEPAFAEKLFHVTAERFAEDVLQNYHNILS